MNAGIELSFRNNDASRSALSSKSFSFDSVKNAFVVDDHRYS